MLTNKSWTTMTNTDFIATLLSLIGAWLLYRSRKRVFDRKNAFGREMFDSYMGKLINRAMDVSLMFIAAFLMLTGAIFLAFEHQESWGWIVLAPITWLAVVGYIPSGRR
jgi:hypothetical protein